MKNGECRMKNSGLKTIGIVLGIGCLAVACLAATNRTAILRGYLQSDADGNGYSWTNVGTFRGTNFIDAQTGLPIGGTTGDFVPRSGTNMTGPLTNNNGYYGDGKGLTNLTK